MNKRIAIISEHASPLAILGGVDNGGQNVYVAEVSMELAQRGYCVDIYTRKDQHHLPEVFHWRPGLRVIHVEAGPATFVEKENLLGYMDDFTDFMIRFINQHQLSYDVVHANFFMSAYVAGILKERLQLPFCVTFHALGLVRLAHQKEMDRFPRERFQIEHDTVKLADAIIAECPQDRADLIHYYGADDAKIHIVPCGCNLSHFHPVSKMEARRLVGVAENEFVLLQLGRMVPRKGVDNVIVAASMLQHEIKNLRVLIVGGESAQPDKHITPEIGRLGKLAAERKVLANVTFVGRRQREELKYYYNAADLFITTPWYEPFGITPLEAMACAVPVIGAAVGGIKYTIDEGATGLLVPPKDPEALYQAVLKIYRNQSLAEEMGARALERVKCHFTWSKVVSLLSKVYELGSQPADRSQPKVIPMYKEPAILRSLHPEMWSIKQE